jgi:hypothetical protein
VFSGDENALILASVFYKVFATLVVTLKEFSGSRVPTKSRFTTAHLGDFNPLYLNPKPMLKARGFRPKFSIKLTTESL